MLRILLNLFLNKYYLLFLLLKNGRIGVYELYNVCFLFCFFIIFDGFCYIGRRVGKRVLNYIRIGKF